MRVKIDRGVLSALGLAMHPWESGQYRIIETLIAHVTLWLFKVFH